MTAPSVPDMVRTFGKIGLLSFGGPAAQIGLMHRILVDENRWLSEADYMRALGFCMMLPGPEAMQLATFAGWRLRGIPGGLIAGGLFVLPGAALIAAIALIYAETAGLPQTDALLLGVKAAVIAIVVSALIGLGRRGLTRADMRFVAAVAFVSIFAFGLPFPLIIAGAAAYGALTAATDGTGRKAPLPAPNWRLVAGWGALWLAPLPVLWLTGQTLLFQIAAFFAKLAVVSFGGAYAVLAYMTQEAVDTRGWLSTAQMVDGLGLAETTPGPLILVTQFVGMLTGHMAGGAGMALIAGAVTLWMTFMPCFLWIFAGAPYIDALPGRPRVSGALQAVTAAVFGVILSLSIWFGLNILFSDVTQFTTGPVDVPAPVWATFDARAFGIVVLACLGLFALRLGALSVISLCVAASALLAASGF